MKCSLLTLSTFIDGELAPQRHAEIDAHLVGCTRCSAGAATLREEKTRIGQLARVSVDPASAQLMLEQVGIAVESAADLPPAAPPPPSPPDQHRPWQGGTSSPSLPWTPRRPSAPDVQPDLPLDGMRPAPPTWDKVAADDPPSAVPVEDTAPVMDTAAAEVTAAVHDSPLQQDVEWGDADEEWLGGTPASDSWEADLPPPADAATPPATAWTEPIAPPAVEPVAPPAPATAPDRPFQAPPPTRLAAASGPSALWTRIHDAITVRLALSRGGDALEDSVQIISGAPTRRGAQLPAQDPVAPSPSGIVAAPPTPPAPAQIERPAEVELNGFAGRAHPPEPIVDVPAMSRPAPLSWWIAATVIPPRSSTIATAPSRSRRQGGTRLPRRPIPSWRFPLNSRSSRSGRARWDGTAAPSRANGNRSPRGRDGG